MESALLWYKLYKTLKYIGFIINRYYICITNIVIDNNQFTMTWYVDNNKVSQVEEKLNTKTIENIPKHFGGLTV